MGHYNKNLTRDFRLRLSDLDMDFLEALAVERDESVSSLVRYIIGEYRRGYDTIQLLVRGLDVHGDTKTDKYDKL